MAAFRKGAVFLPTYCQVRHMAKINIQKPQVDRLPRRLFEALMQPVYKPKKVTQAEICALKVLKHSIKNTEANPYEEYLYRRCVEMINKNKMVAVCQTLHFKAEELKKMRNTLIKNDMNVYQFNNVLMRRAVTDTVYENMLPLFTGRNIYVTGEEVKIKELVTITRKMPQLIIMGVLADNQILSREVTLKIAKLPGLAQLQGELVSILSHGASKTHSLLGSHQNKLSVNLEQRVKQLSGESNEGES